MNRVRSALQPRMRLTEARMDRGLSQREVADYLGTTSVNVSRWERGITQPIPYFRQKLCALFTRAAWELDLAYHEEFSSVSVEEVIPDPCETVYDPSIPVPAALRLIGRDAELAQVRSRLQRVANAALVALNGLPGVGKTALAIAVANDAEVRAHFKHGILWAGLGREPDIQSHLNRWGTLLGLSQIEMNNLQSIEAWATTLRRAIGLQSILLIIDDAWTVEAALMLKVGGLQCAHLITTRFPALAAQVAGQGATAVKALNEEEGIDLLRLLAPRVVEAEPEHACELVEAVGGLPLALTLMGNYLRVQAATGLTRRIAAAMNQLSHASERLDLSAPRGPAEYQTSLPRNTPVSLRAIIALTDQHLPQPTRQALHAFSVFPPRPNSFSEEAALAVAACAVETLDELTDSGLLEINSAGRLTLHQTIADYARQQLCDHHASQRLITFTIAFVEAHRKDYDALERESSNILAALDAASTPAYHTELIRITVAFAPFLLARSRYEVADMHLQRAYNAARITANHEGLASTLLYAGEMARKRGDYEQADKYLQEGLEYAREIDNHERICEILARLGSVVWRSGDYKQAEDYLQEGLTLARELGDPERMSRLLDALGSLGLRQGNYIQTEAYLLEGLGLARQVHERDLICALLINLGVVAGEQGDIARAELYFEEGLTLARQLGHSEWTSLLLSNLGDLASSRGDYCRAELYFQEGLELARRIDHKEWISILLLNSGANASKQTHYDLAEQHFQEGLELARRVGVPQLTSHGLNDYGNLHLARQQPGEAEITFREMLATVPQGSQDLLALAQYGLARALKAQGLCEEARALSQSSVQILEAIGHHSTHEVRAWSASLAVEARKHEV